MVVKQIPLTHPAADNSDLIRFLVVALCAADSGTNSLLSSGHEALSYFNKDIDFLMLLWDGLTI